MKVTSKSLVVAATLKATVDSFQIPLGSPITASNQRQKNLPSFTATRSLPFLSQVRSTFHENEEIDSDDENDVAGSDGNGQHISVLDQLSLDEQKELIMRQLSMVDDDDDEDDCDFNVQQQENDEYFRSSNIDDEDNDYCNYYDNYADGSQQNDQFNSEDSSYYGYGCDDSPEEPENLTPRERRRRRHRRSASPSFGTTASELAESAIRIGGKAANVAKKTTVNAWQSLVENTFADDWDDGEYEANPSERRSIVSNRPPRLNSRPMSRYERDRARTRRPERQQQARQRRQKVDEFATKHPRDEQTEEGSQPQDNRMREVPNRRASRQIRRPIENSTDGMEAADETPTPPSRRRRDEISDKRRSASNSQERIPAGEIYRNPTAIKPDIKDPSWKSLLEKASKVASKKAKAIPRKIVTKAEKTARKAKEFSYKAVSNLLEDEEEEEKRVDVMDALIEDRKEERIVEAEPILMEEWPSTVWSNIQQPPKTPNQSETTQDTSVEGEPFGPIPRRWQRSTPQPPRRRRPKPGRSKKAAVVIDDVVDQEQEQKYQYGLFQLPPVEVSFEEPNVGQEKTGVNESSFRSRRRRVYSPYANQNRRRSRADDNEYSEDKGDEYTDDVDRMGNFVAEAFDTFLWGREDDDRSIRSRRRNQDPNGRQNTDDKTGTKRRKRSGHWRDRMEEQFDEFLGIHEDGKYYDRWANQDSELENKQESNRKKYGSDRNPVSFGRGEVPRGNRGTKKSRPIWEEEDSLLSVLFGTDNNTVRRNARLYRSSSNLPFLGNQRSLLRMVQSVLQSVALVAGRVSQWASVRGSLPQPVIVVGLLSALLSARPGKRWQTLLFVTLALRMMGELLHGYMYDDLDFEDDLSVVKHSGDRNNEFGDDDLNMGKFDSSDFM